MVLATDPAVKKRVDDERKAKRAEKERKQQEWRDGWARWAEEGKRKTDERVKQANEPGFDDGFRLGYTGAKLTRAKTGEKIPSKEIERAAWKAADTNDIPADVRNGFVRGFNAGWGFGWSDK